MIQASRPSGRTAKPVCCSTVTPGKFATFWRRPVIRLKRVVLPLFGGPITATRGERAEGLSFSGGVRTGAPALHPWQSLTRASMFYEAALSSGGLFPGEEPLLTHLPEKRAGRLPGRS